MPGECYRCRAQFGVFKKEHGCKNCGFAFCSKCLHEKSIPVPKRNNTKHHVCVKCYKILSGEGGKETRPIQYDVPQAFVKRVAALNDKKDDGAVTKPQSTLQSQKIPAHIKKLDKADQDIALRLQRLKESDKPKEKVSDADLTSRLADLKGQRNIPDQKPVYHPPDRRTQFEQMNDLLDEMADEVEIDSHAPDPVKDIESRLAQLRHDEGRADHKDVKNEAEHGKTSTLSSSSSKHSMDPSQPASSSLDDGNQVNMEEMQRLMEAAAKELEIDAQRALDGMKKDKELMERLAEIQKRKDEKGADEEQIGQDQSGASARLDAGDLKIDANDDSDRSESESEDASARRIIQQYLEEAKIDDKVSDSQAHPESKGKGKKKKKEIKEISTESETKNKTGGDSNVDSDYDDSDELPYCCICTEDAVIRCKDCSLDLYCKRCFRECHKEIGLTDHETTSYKAPKGYR